VRAGVFLLRHRDTRSAAGLGLVASEARYASVRFAGTDRIERAFATPAQWREIEATLQLGLPPSALPSTHVISAVLLGARAEDYVVEYLTARDFTSDAPERAAVVLDGLLTEQMAGLIVPTMK
jgi:hypothetical protein